MKYITKILNIVDIIIIDLNITSLEFAEHIYRTLKYNTEKQISIILVSNLMTWFNTPKEKELINFVQNITTNMSEESDNKAKDDKPKIKINYLETLRALNVSNNDLNDNNAKE